MVHVKGYILVCSIIFFNFLSHLNLCVTSKDKKSNYENLKLVI